MILGLIGGGKHDSKSLSAFYYHALKELGQPSKMTVILLASDTRNYKQWIKQMTSLFSLYGIDEIGVISEKTDPVTAKKSIKCSKVLYFVGGKPDLLIERLIGKGLLFTINDFDGIIFGYSAGALALCKECLITRDKDYSKTMIIPGLSLTSLIIEVHYSSLRNDELHELAYNRVIHALPNGSALLIHKNRVHAFGDVYVFHRLPNNIS